MMNGVEDSITHTVGRVCSKEYMDHCFTKSVKELDWCYSMLEELRSVIVGVALIHKNREGSNYEGSKFRPIIGGSINNHRSNQSPFNNRRVKEWEERKKDGRMYITKIFR
jgi:hypothetical protein